MKSWLTRVLLLLLLLSALPVSAQAQPVAPDDVMALPASQRQATTSEPRNTAPVAPTGIGQPGVSYAYTVTYGLTDTPYLADTRYLNHPAGLTMDSLDFLYVTEEMGARAIKYDSAGQSQLVIGQAGQPWTTDTLLAYPQDAVVDASGALWIAFNHGVKQVSRLGALLHMLPANPWVIGTDNSHFRYPRGVALDHAGHLFVADGGNHRVQVYDVSGAAPVYQATIGQTGVAGSDAAHFNLPGRMAVDSSNRLYVVDVNNARVQRCTLAASWSCTVFHGTGSAGSGANQLNEPQGIAVDSSNTVWIADSGNARVKRCNTAGVCSVFATGGGLPLDVAVTSSGTVVVSDWQANVVRRYGADGSAQGIFAGSAGVPYLTGSTLFNAPAGVGVAADGNVYVLERDGYRLVKLDPTGAAMWSVGEAGVAGSDAAHFGTYWNGPRGSLAVDNAGRVYVPDTGNHRIQVFNADGTFSRSFGSQGNSNTQFECPNGVAISPITQDILVVDACNERVQVYNNAWSYKITLGVTGVAGADERRFNSPAGVAVDQAGAIYVADRDNYRVQRCTLAAGDYTCITFAGEPGTISASFDHLLPGGVAVDRTGRVAVADLYNNRVQVFDRQGNYLTTVGGRYGTASGEMRTAAALQYDHTGALLVADPDSHRVQRYLNQVPGWTQRNINGFGTPDNGLILSLARFGGLLYAGTDNGSGGQLWRADGASAGGWSAVTTDGFGDRNNGGINHLLVYGGQLYAGTWNWNSATNSSTGGQIWRSADGTHWTRLISAGFGAAANGEIFRFAEFNGALYATTWSYSEGRGGEIWRSTTGNSGSWTRVVNNGFGDPNNVVALSLAVFDGALYAGTLNTAVGGQIWRSADGFTWEPVNASGFGYGSNWAVSALAAFDGWLYAHVRDRGEIWRCQTCNGTDWQRVVLPGFGNAASTRAGALEATNDTLYAVMGNYSTGLEVWRTHDGLAWQQVGFGGFGDSNNRAPFWDNSVLAEGEQLWVATWNQAHGGEIWAYLPRRLYLPLVMR